MNRTILHTLLPISSLLVSTSLLAQVSMYTFSQSVEPYTEITAADGGYVLGTPTFDPPLHNLRAYVDPEQPDGTLTNAGYLAPAIGPGYPIGFDFTYNGDVFDRIGIAHGGWISFGRSEDGNSAVNIFTSDHSAGRPLSHSYYQTPIEPHKRNRIAGMANSQLRQHDRTLVGGPVSEFRVATIGTAPNRVCVIQWKDFSYAYSYDGGSISFQIRLNEVDNSVDVRFGPMTWLQMSGGQYQVGLGGRTNEDYNNRVTVANEPAFLYDWDMTVQGTDSASGCMVAYDSPFNEAYSAEVPTVGLNFNWAPPGCAPPAWPVTISEVTYSQALVSWSLPSGAESFDYVVATVDDPEDPNAVQSGNLEDVSVLVEGLSPLTYYYVFVRSVCNGQPGPWSTATEFRSQAGGVLVCGDAAVTEEYCYATGDYIVWTYSTSDGTSPVRLNLLAGSIVSPNTLEIFYGPDTTGTPFWSTASGGSIPGQVFTSTGAYLTVYLSAPSNGSCQVQEFVEPFEWTVGCLDCTAPLAAFAIGEVDCDELEYEMNVTLVSMGSADELIITNDQGVPSTTVSATGSYTVGPFTSGEPVTLTLVNEVNELCNLESVEFINEPCPVISCGPDVYDYCYVPNDASQWLYQGNGQPIGIRFISGTMGLNAEALIYDGDPFEVDPTGYPGNLANVMQFSTNANDQLYLAIDAPAFWSCEEGYATPWEYVVACYDGCTQPEASFSVVEDCDVDQFSIAVTIAEIGSTGSVTITNDGGAPAVTATAVGTYTVGPFDSQEEVKVDVVGASVLCTWTSPKLTFDCSDVGLATTDVGRLQVTPNPTDGRVKVTLPGTTTSMLDIVIHDLQGRVMFRMPAQQAGPVVELDLVQLPSGAYFLTLEEAGRRYTGMVQLVH
ncbi:MAG: T9SS type A sorting domain-containing protein [Flavobacteriales bacterium]